MNLQSPPMRRRKKGRALILIKITMRKYMEHKTKPNMKKVLKMMRPWVPKVMTMGTTTATRMRNTAKSQIKTKKTKRNSSVKLIQRNKSNLKKMLAVSARLKREIAWKRRKKKQSKEKKKDSSKKSVRWKRKKDRRRNCARSKSKRSVIRKCKRRRRETTLRPKQERKRKLRRRKKSLRRQLQISSSKRQVSSLNRLHFLKIIYSPEE